MWRPHRQAAHSHSSPSSSVTLQTVTLYLWLWHQSHLKDSVFKLVITHNMPRPDFQNKACWRTVCIVLHIMSFGMWLSNSHLLVRFNTWLVRFRLQNNPVRFWKRLYFGLKSDVIMYINLENITLDFWSQTGHKPRPPEGKSCAQWRSCFIGMSYDFVQIYNLVCF